MNAIGTAAAFAAITAAVGFSASASAMPVAELYAGAGRIEAAPALVEFTTDRDIPFSAFVRLDRMNDQTAETAVESYFDFDAIISLGILALAGGAVAAVGLASVRRDKQEREQLGPNWRSQVMRTLEADLTQYARGFRRAA